MGLELGFGAGEELFGALGVRGLGQGAGALEVGDAPLVAAECLTFPKSI